MAFTDIDSATRAQLDADLAEAAARGITGSPHDVVAEFEAELAVYLALPPDARRDYPRGETARLFGTALGSSLESFSWALLSDAYGTDLVVHHGEKYMAPMVVVDQRFEDEEPGKLTKFLASFLD